ncbi:MAG: GDP-mannose 4,6-dehydratase [bacterium]
MDVLITGGAGFIGSHLAEELLRRGQRVHVIDDLSTGDIRNIDPLKPNPNFRYALDTIMNKPLMTELVDRCDVIYHLAAAVGVRLIFDSPVRTIETNIKGTELVLELAAKKNKKVFIASSSEVYGKGLKMPLGEEDELVYGPTTCPRWSYACSKAIDEFLGLAYFNEKKLPVVIGRFFNTVGPRQTGQYGMVIPRFVREALRGEPLLVHGDGKQTRSFTFVGDVVRAVADLMEVDEAAGKVFNIGSDREITILELAKRVVELAGSRSEVVLQPYEEAYGPNFEDLRRRVPDLSKIRRVITYEKLVPMDEILRRVIEYERGQLAQE